MSIEVEHDGDLLVFEGQPALPLRELDEIWHSGCSIPTRWAMDAAGQLWKDNVQGSFHPCTPQRLVAIVEGEENRREMQRKLGLAVDLPEWIRIARSHGWSPPSSWKDPT